MMSRADIIRLFVLAECSGLVGATYGRFEQLGKAGDVYRICNEVFAAELMPPKYLPASDRGFAREVHEECLQVAVELRCVTVSARRGSG